MNPNESWIAEQARLLMLEDGFGPSAGAKSGVTSGAATGGNEGDATTGRSTT